MPNTTESIKPEYIIELVLRQRWFIIIPFCLSMTAGLYLAFTLPRVYQSETLILVEPQRVPEDYVRSVVSSDIDARISTISQQIMSRTNLEKVIDEFKLYSGPEYEGMYMEDKIEGMRKRITVDVTRARRGTDAFSISFKGKNPERVMKVANVLANYFIDQNLKVREAQAIGTSDFLEDELNTMRKRLEGVEEILKKYRVKYMGALPEQLETNLRILDRLQTQLSDRQESLRDAKNRLAPLENLSPVYQSSSAEGIIEEDLSNPNLLKQQLANLKLRYTDQHPDVIRLNKIIADLEAKTEKETGETTEESQAEASVSETAMRTPYMTQREEIKGQIKTLEAEILKINNQTKYYQKRVEDTPKREQELMSLRRDHQNIQESYNSLLNRKLEAEIAVNMEKKQKGERFRILDPARLPEKPVSPNMKKLFMLAVAAGLGIGAGIIFLLEYFNTSFKKPEDIESFLGLPVLVTIPPIYQPKDIRLQKLNQILSIFFIMISLALFAGFGVLTIKGVDQTMELIRRLM